MIDFEKLAAFTLMSGKHKTPEQGVCAMEAVAWLEGLKHTDRPKCTSPVIASFVRALNDCLLDSERQRLVAYLPRLVGTVSREHEDERARYLDEQAYTKCWPFVFRAYGMNASAAMFDEPYDTRNFMIIARCIAGAMPLKHRITPMWDAMARRCWVFGRLDVAACAALPVDSCVPGIEDLLFEVLDGVLQIGPSGGFSQPIEPRVEAYRELVGA